MALTRFFSDFVKFFLGPVPIGNFLGTRPRRYWTFTPPLATSLCTRVSEDAWTEAIASEVERQLVWLDKATTKTAAYGWS